MLYVGNGNITLKCLVHRDLTDASDYGILYEKPDGTRSQVSTTEGTTLHENNKAILYSVDDDTFFDQAGLWKFQSFAIFDGTTALGHIAQIKVHENLIA